MLRFEDKLFTQKKKLFNQIENYCSEKCSNRVKRSYRMYRGIRISSNAITVIFYEKERWLSFKCFFFIFGELHRKKGEIFGEKNVGHWQPIYNTYTKWWYLMESINLCSGFFYTNYKRSILYFSNFPFFFFTFFYWSAKININSFQSRLDW